MEGFSRIWVVRSLVVSPEMKRIRSATGERAGAVLECRIDRTYMAKTLIPLLAYEGWAFCRFLALNKIELCLTRCNLKWQNLSPLHWAKLGVTGLKASPSSDENTSLSVDPSYWIELFQSDVSFSVDSTVKLMISNISCPVIVYFEWPLLSNSKANILLLTTTVHGLYMHALTVGCISNSISTSNLGESGLDGACLKLFQVLCGALTLCIFADGLGLYSRCQHSFLTLFQSILFDCWGTCFW